MANMSVKDVRAMCLANSKVGILGSRIRLQYCYLVYVYITDLVYVYITEYCPYSIAEVQVQ